MNIARRLRRLEEKLTDGSGRVPHTPEWTAYWMAEMDRFVARDHAGPRLNVPLEALCAWMRAQPDCDSAYEGNP
jgi:hypothetical protein